MIIDQPGKYEMMNGECAVIFRVDRTTVVGRLEGEDEPLIWSIDGDPSGHDLRHRIVSKHVNVPGLALQIIKMVKDLTADQRADIFAIVAQQACLNCGRMLDPGAKCLCD